MKFSSGQDFGEGEVRLLLQAIFKYNFSRNWAGVVESGWGWNAYPTGNEAIEDTLATVVPTTLGVEYRFPWGESNLWPHFAAGGGFYSLGVKDGPNSWANAGDDVERLTWTSLGLYQKAGVEYVSQNAVAVNFDFLFHQIFSENEKYQTTDVDTPPELANTWGLQNTSFWEFRLGINYYFITERTGPVPEEEP
jgi:hypothetical protein